jgi:hypothetical protein
MHKVGMEFLLHAGILSFVHLEICGGRIMNALQCFKNLIFVVRFFVNWYPDADFDYLSIVSGTQVERSWKFENKVGKTVKKVKNQIPYHEIEPTPSKDKATDKGNIPSF